MQQLVMRIRGDDEYHQGYFEALIADAEAGETDQAREFLRLSAAFLRDRRRLPPCAVDYLAARIEQAAEAAIPWDVQLLDRSKRTAGADDRLVREAAAQYATLLNKLGSWSLEEADARAEDRFGLRDGQVASARRNINAVSFEHWKVYQAKLVAQEQLSPREAALKLCEVIAARIRK